MSGAAGKQLDLRAEEHLLPRRITLHGIAAWDAQGSAVLGARVAEQPWPEPAQPHRKDKQLWVLDETAQAMLMAARSDRDGLLRIPLPAGQCRKLRAHRGGQFSDEIDPCAGKHEIELALH